MFGIVGNAQTFESSEELKDFINLNLEKNKIGSSVTQATQYKLEDYNKLKCYANINVEKIVEFEPYSLELIVDDNTYHLHTIPTSDARAVVLIETADKQIIAILTVDILDYDGNTDEYKISWAQSSGNITNSSCDTSIMYRGRHDCRTGAGMVTAAGRVIAFGSFLGCLPCAFVGGAISTLGALGYIGCVLSGN